MVVPFTLNAFAPAPVPVANIYVPPDVNDVEELYVISANICFVAVTGLV